MTRTGLFLLLALTALCGGCKSPPDSCSEGECDAADGGGGEDGGPTDIVFVAPAPMGNNSHAGTKDKPVASIGVALGKGNRIRVCEGEYRENLKVTGGVEIIGGFDCSLWSPAARPTKVIPSTPGIALEVRSVSAAVTIEDLAFEAQKATVAGESSIAAFVVDARNVTFRRVALTAGEGASATPGTTGTNFLGDTAQSGLAPNAAAGGGGGVAACKDSTSSIGGRGGNGVATPAERDGVRGSSDPAAQTSVDRDGSGGIGGTTSCGNPVARPGADGAAKPAARGATTPGTFTDQGWRGQAGEAGGNGEPGQGGGGGGGKSTSSSGGGGGGAGGCGGAGGQGGAAGGSSFALLAYQSTVRLEGCALTAHDAGNGADGTAGGKGQGGAAGGSLGSACPGAEGGNGAGGGGGGGGAGGISASIGYAGAGAAPTTDSATTLTYGKAGAPGKGKNGGDPGAGAIPTGNKGNPGGDGRPGDRAPTKDLGS